MLLLLLLLVLLVLVCKRQSALLWAHPLTADAAAAAVFHLLHTYTKLRTRKQGISPRFHVCTHRVNLTNAQCVFPTRHKQALRVKMNKKFQTLSCTQIQVKLMSEHCLLLIFVFAAPMTQQQRAKSSESRRKEKCFCCCCCCSRKSKWFFPPIVLLIELAQMQTITPNNWLFVAAAAHLLAWLVRFLKLVRRQFHASRFQLFASNCCSSPALIMKNLYFAAAALFQATFCLPERAKNGRQSAVCFNSASASEFAGSLLTTFYSCCCCCITMESICCCCCRCRLLVCLIHSVWREFYLRWRQSERALWLTHTQSESRRRSDCSSSQSLELNWIELNQVNSDQIKSNQINSEAFSFLHVQTFTPKFDRMRRKLSSSVCKSGNLLVQFTSSSSSSSASTLDANTTKRARSTLMLVISESVIIPIIHRAPLVFARFFYFSRLPLALPVVVGQVKQVKQVKSVWSASICLTWANKKKKKREKKEKRLKFVGFVQAANFVRQQNFSSLFFSWLDFTSWLIDPFVLLSSRSFNSTCTHTQT